MGEFFRRLRYLLNRRRFDQELANLVSVSKLPFLQEELGAQQSLQGLSGPVVGFDGMQQQTDCCGIPPESRVPEMRTAWKTVV